MRRKHWISQLIRGLHDEDEEVRAEAADRLGDLGLEARRALPSLVEAIADEDPYVGWSATRAVGRIGIDSDEVVSALEEMREGGRDETRLLASGALITLKVRPQEMLMEIVAGLIGNDPELKGLAAEILLELDPEIHDGLPPLRDAVEHDPERIPLFVVEMLAEFGTPDARVLEALIDLDDDPDSMDRAALARALERVGKGNIEVARLLLDKAKRWDFSTNDDSLAAIYCALDVVEDLGSIMPSLVDILTGWSFSGREEVAQIILDNDHALDSFRPTPETVTRLIAALADKVSGYEIYYAVEQVLRRTGSLDEDTLILLCYAFGELGEFWFFDDTPHRPDLWFFENLSSREWELAIPALLELLRRAECCGVAPDAARALGVLSPALAVSHLLPQNHNIIIYNNEYNDIISEICARSIPEEILAGYRSRQCLRELLYLGGCGGHGFKDAARRTLREVLGGDLIPTLGQVLEGPYDERLKRVAVEILGDQGRTAVVLIPTLSRVLEAGTDPGLRSRILDALVRIGQPDDVILPLWIGLEDRDRRVRSSAMAALSSLGPLAGDAIHGIAAVARNSHAEPALRLAALRFIQSNEPDAELFVGQPLQPLIASLKARAATAARCLFQRSCAALLAIYSSSASSEETWDSVTWD